MGKEAFTHHSYSCKAPTMRGVGQVVDIYI